jgi:hypothetical protein
VEFEVSIRTFLQLATDGPALESPPASCRGHLNECILVCEGLKEILPRNNIGAEQQPFGGVNCHQLVEQGLEETNGLPIRHLHTTASVCCRISRASYFLSSSAEWLDVEHFRTKDRGKVRTGKLNLKAGQARIFQADGGQENDRKG